VVEASCEFTCPYEARKTRPRAYQYNLWAIISGPFGTFAGPLWLVSEVLLDNFLLVKIPPFDFAKGRRSRTQRDKGGSPRVS